MKIEVPRLSLVVLVGVSGSGKSTFARKHFLPTEIVSSDFCRALLADDENDLSVTSQAFDLVHQIARQRLALGRLTVIDATNVQPNYRAVLVEIAREFHAVPVAIVLDLPEEVCIRRTEARPDRDFGASVVRRQRSQLRRGLRRLRPEGFRHIHELTSEEEVDAASIVRAPL
jgi:protein phosphatase